MLCLISSTVITAVSAWSASTVSLTLLLLSELLLPDSDLLLFYCTNAPQTGVSVPYCSLQSQVGKHSVLTHLSCGW